MIVVSVVSLVVMAELFLRRQGRDYRGKRVNGRASTLVVKGLMVFPKGPFSNVSTTPVASHISMVGMTSMVCIQPSRKSPAKSIPATGSITIGDAAISLPVDGFSCKHASQFTPK